MSRQDVDACNPTGCGFDVPTVPGRGFGSPRLQMGPQVRTGTRQLENGFHAAVTVIRRDHFCAMSSNEVAGKLRR